MTIAVFMKPTQLPEVMGVVAVTFLMQIRVSGIKLGLIIRPARFILRDTTSAIIASVFSIV
ncbi:MAG: hypothetical protein ACJAX5_000598 [Patiriisocius sp.]|jgi:hypothetical protein